VVQLLLHMVHWTLNKKFKFKFPLTVLGGIQQA
jgi:hypothetical protein